MHDPIAQLEKSVLVKVLNWEIPIEKCKVNELESWPRYSFDTETDESCTLEQTWEDLSTHSSVLQKSF